MSDTSINDDPQDEGVSLEKLFGQNGMRVKPGPKPGEFIPKVAIVHDSETHKELKYSTETATLLADDCGAPIPADEGVAWVRNLLFKTKKGAYFFQLRQPHLDGFIQPIAAGVAMAYYTNYSITKHIPLEEAFEGIYLLVEEA